MISHKQGMLYELARELIGSQIGTVSHEIGVEETKPTPDQERIAELEARIVAFARERENLDPADDEAVLDVLQHYSRQPISLPPISG